MYMVWKQNNILEKPSHPELIPIIPCHKSAFFIFDTERMYIYIESEQKNEETFLIVLLWCFTLNICNASSKLVINVNILSK